MANSFRVSMSVPEIGQTLNQIGLYDRKAALAVEQAVQSSTKAIGAGARQRVPVRSGALKKKIATRFENKGVTGIVAAKTPYAHLVEFGAKAVVIKPVNKKAMRIDENGIRRFATEVHVPQRAERPFLRPAFEDEKPALLKNLAKAVQP